MLCQKIIIFWMRYWYKSYLKTRSLNRFDILYCITNDHHFTRNITKNLHYQKTGNQFEEKQILL